MASAGFHLYRHHGIFLGIRDEIDLALLFRHVVIQRNPLSRQLLGYRILINGTEIRIAIIQICCLGCGYRISGHQHARIRLVQLEFRRLSGTFQGRFRLRHTIGFQRDSSISKPNKIFLVAGIPRILANRSHREATIAIRQLRRHLLEHLPHLQCTRTRVLGDVMPVLMIQIGLHTSYSGQITTGIQKTFTASGMPPTTRYVRKLRIIASCTASSTDRSSSQH